MKTTVAILTLLISTSAFAQETVVVKSVNDRRTNGHFASLAINVELPKIKDSEVAASRVLISKATDETGRDLLDHEQQEPEFNVHMGRNTGNPVAVLINLKNPDRKATKVREVRGEIELLLPAKDPNSIAEIAKFTASPGKPLTHKALKANGVEIALITPAQIEAEKKKRAESKKKELAEMGYEGEDLETMVKDFLSSLLGGDENDLLVRLKDPNSRIQQITYVDAAGEEKPVMVREEDGFTTLSTWAGKPQADWKMVVKMKTPKNVVKYAFALTDVPLP